MILVISPHHCLLLKLWTFCSLVSFGDVDRQHDDRSQLMDELWSVGGSNNSELLVIPHLKQDFGSLHGSINMRPNSHFPHLWYYSTNILAKRTFCVCFLLKNNNGTQKRMTTISAAGRYQPVTLTYIGLKMIQQMKYKSATLKQIRAKAQLSMATNAGNDL